jgi:hypothetical protein
LKLSSDLKDDEEQRSSASIIIIDPAAVIMDIETTLQSLIAPEEQKRNSIEVTAYQVYLHAYELTRSN